MVFDKSLYDNLLSRYRKANSDEVAQNLTVATIARMAKHLSDKEVETIKAVPTDEHFAEVIEPTIYKKFSAICVDIHEIYSRRMFAKGVADTFEE